MQNQNSVPIQILQQSYVLKYLFNSQMIAAMMLIDQVLPITYYLTQQAFSSTVFCYSPAYGSAESTYVHPSLPFNIRISAEDIPHQTPSQPIFRRFRLSGNFLLNNSQCLLMLLVLAVAQALVYGRYRLKSSENEDKIIHCSQSQKLMVFLLNRIHTTFESSFLLVVISVLLQIQ